MSLVETLLAQHFPSAGWQNETITITRCMCEKERKWYQEGTQPTTTHALGNVSCLSLEQACITILCPHSNADFGQMQLPHHALTSHNFRKATLQNPNLIDCRTFFLNKRDSISLKFKSLGREKITDATLGFSCHHETRVVKSVLLKLTFISKW